ncbi:ABC transporter permease [Aquibaculum arenosum]|uniref:ABC transporter permease subunit n=1 Tax=Aquibaculum arenosum TaxID=3032591 RepID=A0ABT5YKU4_9PROT|nr:ABC transporter permease subunit [Fodinicurvata sp. CAU 1616]MDF2095571.1 ABC transporter permease subunit [Fodinicurvata sp. CAU 1616]
MLPDLRGYGWMLWEGLQLTLLVGLASLLLAILLGLLGAWAKLGASRIARGIAGTYTTVVRGVPELLLILLVFYGTPTLIQNTAARWGTPVYINLDPFVSGVLTLGFIYGAFATEVFRGAFLAVPPGQIEAARACGMSRHLTFRRIVLPQVWRFALPGLGNVWMVLIKATALISVIQLDELMRKTQIAVGATKLPFTFYFVASLMYLGITVASMLLQQRFEAMANRGVRRA